MHLTVSKQAGAYLPISTLRVLRVYFKRYQGEYVPISTLRVLRLYFKRYQCGISSHFDFTSFTSLFQNISRCKVQFRLYEFYEFISKYIKVNMFPFRLYEFYDFISKDINVVYLPISTLRVLRVYFKIYQGARCNFDFTSFTSLFQNISRCQVQFRLYEFYEFISKDAKVNMLQILTLRVLRVYFKRCQGEYVPNFDFTSFTSLFQKISR